MRRADWLLLMVAARVDAPIDPVRLQKGMFLLAQGGAVPPRQRYAFEPYSYGPMSKAIYRDVGLLVGRGELERVAVAGHRWMALRATPAGARRAAEMSAKALAAVHGIREIVDARSFTELLEYVYARYPQYATRSVFRRPS